MQRATVATIPTRGYRNFCSRQPQQRHKSHRTQFLLSRPRSMPLPPIRLPASAQIDFRSSPLYPCCFHPLKRSSQRLSSSPPTDGSVSTPVRVLPPRRIPDWPCSNSWEFYQTAPFRCPVGFPTVCRRQILSLRPTKHPCAELKPPYSVHESGSVIRAGPDPDPETPAVRCCASLIQQCNSKGGCMDCWTKRKATT